MRIFLTFIIVTFFPNFLLSQTTVTVIMTGPDKDRITAADMFDTYQNEIITNSYRDTLKYHFTRAPKVEQYWIRYFIGEKMYRQTLWLNDGQITVYAHLGEDDLVIDSILNSSIQREVDDYYVQLGQLPKEKRNLFKLGQIKRFINTPFSFEIGDSFLMTNSINKSNLIPLKQVFDLQGDQFFDRSDYKNVVGKLNVILNIDRINLDQYVFIDRFNKNDRAKMPEAKYYLLDFWYLGCAPCREDHKKMKLMSKSLKDKKVEVIGLSIDENILEWQKYLRNNEYDWTNYIVPETNMLLNDLKISSYPSYFLIDSNYNFIGVFANIDQFQYDFLDKLK